jgi:TRAP-type C4-dicarboxylate transport system substrate-binding protein
MKKGGMEMNTRSRTNKKYALLIVLLAAFVLTSCGGGANNTASDSETNGLSGNDISAETTKFSFSCIQNPGTITLNGAVEWGALWNEYSNGKYDFEVFSNSQLAGGDQATEYEMTQKGQIDICFSPGGMVSNSNVNASAFSLPWLWKGYEQIDKVLYSEDSEVVEIWREWFADQNLYFFGFFEMGFKELSNNVRTVVAPTDLKNLKIRVSYNSMYMDLFNLLGADPTSMSWSEVFTALQQGAIEGQENALVSVYMPNSLYEVQPYVTVWDYNYEPWFAVCNLDLWNSLSVEDQEAGQKAFREAAADTAQLLRDNEQLVIQQLRDEHDVEVTVLTEAQKQVFREASQPIYDKYVPMFDENFYNILSEATK